MSPAADNRATAAAGSECLPIAALSGGNTMSGSKMTTLTSEQMRAARTHGESRTDWARVRREVDKDTQAVADNHHIGEVIARKRGRPVEGERKQAISLRVPEAVLARWKATGPSWQTRMVERLSAP
jgi:uncharacterized protein (DUF4415 family)